MARYKVFLVLLCLCALVSAEKDDREGSHVRRSRSTPPLAGSISRLKCLEYSSLVPSTGDEVTSLCSGGSTSLKGEVRAKLKEFPHAALVGHGEKDDITWICGGSVISPQFILTAAFCMATGNIAPKWVRVGDLNIKETNDGAMPQEVAVLERIPHPDFKPPSFYNDIALLKLEKNLVLNEFVRPACLHTTFHIGQSEAIASGWGRTLQGNSSNTDYLMKAVLPIQSTEFCNSTYGNLTSVLDKGIYEESIVCAGWMENKIPCYGLYSGNPLQLLMKEPHCMYDIIGIISFGKRLCAVNLSGYTRVSHYVSWIEKIVWP